MGTPLTQDDPPDGRAAHGTRLSVATIHAMQTREVAGLAARVPEIRNGTPPVTNAGSQDGTDAQPKCPDFAEPERRCSPGGTDPCPEKCFVRVDVSDTGDLSLIQQERLEPNA